MYLQMIFLETKKSFEITFAIMKKILSKKENKKLFFSSNKNRKKNRKIYLYIFILKNWYLTKKS